MKRVEKPKVSVIIPVYNGERYLRECVNSILVQTLCEIEVILVDDGSVDSSPAICDKYAMVDGRVRVTHKTNEGINATRRRGVEMATGAWVAFSDQDDTMPPNALYSMYVLTDDTDMVIGFPEKPAFRHRLTLEGCRRNMITARSLPPSPWAKLYRRELLTSEVFDFPRDIDGAEDMIMNIRLMFRLTRAPRICYEKVYNFRRNTSSVSHTSVASLDYEQLFDETRSRSIPSDEIGQYMHEILWSRVNGINSVAWSSPRDVASGEHEYFQRLLSDIRRYRYRLSPRQWMMLHSHSASIVRFCGFVRMTYNSLHYRMGKKLAMANLRLAFWR